MTNCPGCDAQIVIEVIVNEKGYSVGSVTLHDTISFDELGLIKSMAIDTAKTMAWVDFPCKISFDELGLIKSRAIDTAKTMTCAIKWVDFPCKEFPMYKIGIIKTVQIYFLIFFFFFFFLLLITLFFELSGFIIPWTGCSMNGWAEIA